MNENFRDPWFQRSAGLSKKVFGEAILNPRNSVGSPASGEHVVRGIVSVFENGCEKKVNANVHYTDDPESEKGYKVNKVTRESDNLNITDEAFLSEALVSRISSHRNKGKIRELRNTFFQ
jgi:hypothetical protein